jgi:hypothetical protein
MPLTQHLTSVQLQAVLRNRNVELPDRPQSQNYYVEQCRQYGIFNVTQSELNQATPAAEASITLEVDSLVLMQGPGRAQPRSVKVRVE